MRILVCTILALGLAACAIKSPAPPTAPNRPGEPSKQTSDTKPVAPPPSPGQSPSQHPVHAPTASTYAAASAPHKHSTRGPVPFDKALGWLKNGNTRFVKHTLRNDGDHAKDRARLVAGQKPHSIVLSCSDSRVPPEVVFDQKLGEIFVIRTAGESLDASALASIEYAIEHLGSNLIVVMGHESCGAVKAALATLDGADAGSPWLNKLVQDLHPHVRSFKGKPVSEGALVEGWANVTGVAKDLVDRSQIVRDAVNSGEVKIQTALYHLGSGVVEFK